MEKLEEITKAVVLMFSMYSKEPDKQVVKAFVAALKDYDLQDVRKAISTVVRTNEFVPTLAGIIKHLEPTDEDLSVVARGQASFVLDCVRRDNTNYKFAEDEVTKYLMKNVYSHRYIEDMNDSQVIFWQKEFIQQYLNHSKSNVAQEHIKLKSSNPIMLSQAKNLAKMLTAKG